MDRAVRAGGCARKERGLESQFPTLAGHRNCGYTGSATQCASRSTARLPQGSLGNGSRARGKACARSREVASLVHYTRGRDVCLDPGELRMGRRSRSANGHASSRPLLLSDEGQFRLEQAFENRARRRGSFLDFAEGYIRALDQEGLLLNYLRDGLDPFEVIEWQSERRVT